MRSYPIIGFRNGLSGRVCLNPEELVITGHEACTKLCAWYDFSDMSTVFRDAGATTPAANGDAIRHVTNKAYDGLGASSISLNASIQQINPSAATCPIYTAPATGTGTDGSGLNFGICRFTGAEWLESSRAIGNVATNQMGGVNLNHQEQTISFVIRNDSVSETADHFYLSYQNAARRITAIGLDSTANRMYYWPEATAGFVDSATTFTGGIESWTIVMGDANSTCADIMKIRIYRNGVLLTTSTTNFTAANRDLTANSPSVQFMMGASPASVNRLVGGILEYVHYTGPLSTEQHDQLNTYYSNRYGIDYNLL